MGKAKIESVAIIGAGASGAVAAAAFQAENYFKRVRVYERRETPGGTWIYDGGNTPDIPIYPGELPPSTDPPLKIPDGLPRTTPPSEQERYLETPVYETLTTNVPSIAMAYSDSPFAYGPFAPHYVPFQYISNYFSAHKTDRILEVNTTLEDLSRVVSSVDGEQEGWKLTLRKHDPIQKADTWWEERYDAVILANGHYTVPFVPQVKGLEEYIKKFPGRIVHSKAYRNPTLFAGKKVLVIGNSASGHDVAQDVLKTASLPVYQSRRSPGRWDGDEPPSGIAWKPIIVEYLPSGRIVFSDGTYLDDIDVVFYCTGYKPSFPFWNEEANGRPLYDYAQGKLVDIYWHTFFHDFPTLGIIGMPRVLTFRSMEYQAIALARLWSGRDSTPLPPIAERKKWEDDRVKRTRAERLKFHDVPWDSGETKEYLGHMYDIAGLPTLFGEGRTPPVLDKETVWAIEHVKKYPDPKTLRRQEGEADGQLKDWVVVPRGGKDTLSFI